MSKLDNKRVDTPEIGEWVHALHSSPCAGKVVAHIGSSPPLAVVAGVEFLLGEPIVRSWVYPEGVLWQPYEPTEIDRDLVEGLSLSEEEE